LGQLAERCKREGIGGISREAVNGNTHRGNEKTHEQQE
jgi:hypothetical protein